MKRLLHFASVLLALPMLAQSVDLPPATPAARIIRTLADGDLRNLYGPIGFAPVWSRDGLPTAQAQAVISVLTNADRIGLDPLDYGASQWPARLSSLAGDAALAQFDVALTAAAMRYVSDAHLGRVDPRDAGFDLDVDSKRLYLPAFIAQLSSSSDPAALLASIEPQHAEYHRLVDALARYRTLAQSPAPTLPTVTKLTQGQTYDALPQLADVLRRLGDLDPNAQVEGTLYEGAIVDAVRHFQSRHGLDPDGVLGRTTFAQLNVPAWARVQQIEWSLERWRWMPERFEERSIVVNIPEFVLRARDAKSGEELAMRVIVGKAAGHRTPVFGGDVRNVVFRPYWSVPPNIQRAEIAPKLERDATYLARNDYELVDASGAVVGTDAGESTIALVRSGALRVRQKPGHSNALGLVKFLFPNDNNVYLHSTPQPALFERARRDFSHGCIRVQDPIALAAWTLSGEEGWSREKIERAIESGNDDAYVQVKRAVDVVIFYSTAVADADGEVRFLSDIYGHDAQLAKLLEPKHESAPMVLAAR